MIPTSIRSVFVATLFALFLTTASAQPRLTDVTIFSTDFDGGYANGITVDTRPGNSGDVFLQLSSSFVTGPADANVQPNLTLPTGPNFFNFAFTSGAYTANSGMNLFFNDSLTPSISVFGPTATTTSPQFYYVDTSAVTIGVPSSVHLAAAGTLSFVTGGYQVSLQDFLLRIPAVQNLDLVGSTSTGADGTTDFTGKFTLTVIPVAAPEPGLTLWVTGLGVLALGAYRKNRCA